MRNKHGWTPLMLNARYGNEEISRIIMAKGAKADISCPTGQTAIQIAAFWNNKEVYDALSNDQVLKGNTPYFTQSPLKRFAEKRDNAEWLQEVMHKSDSKFLPTRQGIPLVTRTKGERASDVVLTSFTDIAQYIHEDQSNVIFLGLREQDDTAFFTLDFSDMTKEMLSEKFQGSQVMTPYPGFLFLSRDDAAICGHAYSMWDWHRRHLYCPTCGTETVMKEAGYKRRCTNKTCSTNRGDLN